MVRQVAKILELNLMPKNIYIKEERKTYSWKISENYDRDTEKGVTNT